MFLLIINRYFTIRITLSLCLVLFTACGGGGGGDSSAGKVDDSNGGTGYVVNTNVTFTGSVLAPDGIVSYAVPGSHADRLLSFFLGSNAVAAVTGMNTVSGITVELIAIDAMGNQVGDVLATTTTSTDGLGAYSLTARAFNSSRFVLRATSNGITMSSLATGDNIVISPVSEYLFQQVIARTSLGSNIALLDFMPSEIVFLTDFIIQRGPSVAGLSLVDAVSAIEFAAPAQSITGAIDSFSDRKTFSSESLPGFYEFNVPGITDADLIRFNVDFTGSIQSEVNTNDSFTWNIDERGRIMLDMDSRFGLVDQYTLLDGVTEQGGILLEIDNNNTGSNRELVYATTFKKVADIGITP